ncbi:MCE family protein [Mycobacterium vicinigordonae]|uniref:MCE family protein n=2 Tax=Mycobacterium vicinigordonae TaxID=1719132 RepID=A0A7D6HY46_9MYCO|nr:MCE family protein [Mycobacterium vicinigordonae]QLL07555.1 MCE family protein [Mycobacterium vicinigordonae]
MNASRRAKIALSVALGMMLVGGIAVVAIGLGAERKTRITAYFDNTNGLFSGDEVRILGVAVGKVDTIVPQPDRAKVTMYVDSKYKIPANAMAAILSPQLVTARAVQLTPAYTGGPVMSDGAVIPLDRTAVPVEWDDLRQELQKLTDALQPTKDGGLSKLGELVSTAANNLRGRGVDIRQAVVKMAQALSILGDHSDDIFLTIKNLATVVSALQDSTDAMQAMNRNLAAVTSLLADDPDEVGHAIADLNAVVGDANHFIADNREALGTTADKLASITTVVHDSVDDIKQALHVFPNVLQNVTNIFQPAQASLTGALAMTNFNNPISFLCGAIEAASRLGNERSAKLCVQYLAPIIKNRQWNALPIGLNPFVGAAARPNEITYTEDWMRPDFVPAPPPVSPPLAPAPTDVQASAAPGGPASAEQGATASAGDAIPTNPAQGLPGMMVPPGGGS